MSETVEIDEQRQKEINELDARMIAATHFDMLGLKPGASIEQAKAAFREATKKFHPDRFYGKSLGPFRVKLDRIFRRLVEANQVLTDPARREEYLTEHPELRVGASTPSAIARARTAEEEAREAERRARLLRHPYMARNHKAHEYVIKARSHMAKSEYGHAFTQLNLAIKVDPESAEIKGLLTEVRRKYDLQRSETDYKHALVALERGDTNTALQALRMSSNANPQNALSAAKLASLLEDSDPKDASTFAQRAVDADPKNAGHRVLLGRLLEAAGMKAMAKKQFEEALKLDPEHPDVKKHVKKRWPF